LGQFDRPACIKAFAFKFLDFYDEAANNGVTSSKTTFRQLYPKFFREGNYWHKVLANKTLVRRGIKVMESAIDEMSVGEMSVVE
jgi:hypothetical protein